MFLSRVFTPSRTIKNYIVIIYICCYWFQFFSTAQTTERHVNVCFEINVKHVIKKAKKDETVKFKNYTRKKITIHVLC